MPLPVYTPLFDWENFIYNMKKEEKDTQDTNYGARALFNVHERREKKNCKKILYPPTYI